MSTQGNIGENMLSRFSKGPFESFKNDCEFSPVDAIVEEILGRLSCLRRNQRIVDVSSPIGGLEIINSLRLMRDHEMCVLNIVKPDDDLEDIKKEFRNLTVHVNESNDKLDNILATNGIPKEFALLSIDSATVDTEFCPYVVVSTVNPAILPTVECQGGFKDATSFWNAKGYSPVCMAREHVVFIRNDLLSSAEVKGVVLRNPDMLFDWNAYKQ